MPFLYSFIESQRDIIANDSVYNSRFNYAVSHKQTDSSSVDLLPEQAHQIVKVFHRCIINLLFQNNHIRTSKYTFLTFLPLNLLEQFQRLANFYFLCLFILQVGIALLGSDQCRKIGAFILLADV